MNAEEALITIIAIIIAVAVVAAFTALIAFLGGWSYCYLTGKQCTLADMLLHGLAILSITFIIGLVLRATLECKNREH